MIDDINNFTAVFNKYFVEKVKRLTSVIVAVYVLHNSAFLDKLTKGCNHLHSAI